MNIPRWMYDEMKAALSSLGLTRYKQYLALPHWKAVQTLYRKNKCQRCWVRGERLNLHHKHYRNLGKETANDFLTLCDYCHDVEHKALLENEERQEAKQKKQYKHKQPPRKKQAIEILQSNPDSGWILRPLTPAERGHNKKLISEMMVKLDNQRRYAKTKFDYKDPLLAKPNEPQSKKEAHGLQDKFKQFIEAKRKD